MLLEIFILFLTIPVIYTLKVVEPLEPRHALYFSFISDPLTDKTIFASPCVLQHYGTDSLEGVKRKGIKMFPSL